MVSSSRCFKRLIAFLDDVGEGQTKLNKIYSKFWESITLTPLLSKYYPSTQDISTPHCYYFIVKVYALPVSQHQLVLQLYIPTTHRKKLKYTCNINIHYHYTSTQTHPQHTSTLHQVLPVFWRTYLTEFCRFTVYLALN